MKLLVEVGRRQMGRLVLFGLGMIAGVFASGVAASSGTQAEPQKTEVPQYYRVERQMETFADPSALQELLNQRVQEGWVLQALDHERLVFRRAPRSSRRAERPQE